MVSILAGFAAHGETPGSPAEAGRITDDRNGLGAVRQAAGLFSSGYISRIDEIASFQIDPDYERAEARRQEEVELGGALATRFQELERSLQGKLDGLGGLTGTPRGHAPQP